MKSPDQEKSLLELEAALHAEEGLNLTPGYNGKTPSEGLWTSTASAIKVIPDNSQTSVAGTTGMYF